MPTYEYNCLKCGHEFELFQSITVEPITVCPKDLCGQKRWGKGPVKRSIGGGAGLIFKGSGFYITDYRSENYKQAAKKESESSSPKSGESKSGESKSGGGGETKPAKTESKPTTSPPPKSST